MQNFGSGIVWFESIRISGPLLCEHISDVGFDMSPTCSVWVSNPRTIFSGRITSLDLIYPFDVTN